MQTWFVYFSLSVQTLFSSFVIDVQLGQDNEALSACRWQHCPGCSMLRFYWKETFSTAKQPSFHLGLVLPSIDVFTSDVPL